MRGGRYVAARGTAWHRPRFAARLGHLFALFLLVLLLGRQVFVLLVQERVELLLQLVVSLAVAVAIGGAPLGLLPRICRRRGRHRGLGAAAIVHRSGSKVRIRILAKRPQRAAAALSAAAA